MKDKKRTKVLLPLQTSFLCITIVSCITAGVRGLCRHDSLSAKCQFAVKVGMVGKETQLFSTAFQPSHAFCVCVQMLLGQGIALKDLLELPKQQFWSKAANSCLGEGTGPLV